MHPPQMHRYRGIWYFPHPHTCMTRTLGPPVETQDTNTCIHACIHTNTCSHTSTHRHRELTHIHANTDPHNEHTCIATHTHMCTPTYVKTQIPTQKQMCKHLHAGTRMTCLPQEANLRHVCTHVCTTAHQTTRVETVRHTSCSEAL